jgi:hypothetical protein
MQFTTARTEPSQSVLYSPVSSAPVLSSLQHALSLLSLFCIRQSPLLPFSVHYSKHWAFSVCSVFVRVLCSPSQFITANTEPSQSVLYSSEYSAPLLSSLQQTLSLLSLFCIRQCPLLPRSVNYSTHWAFSVCSVFASVLCSRAHSSDRCMKTRLNSTVWLSPPQTDGHLTPTLPSSAPNSQNRLSQP